MKKLLLGLLVAAVPTLGIPASASPAPPLTSASPATPLASASPTNPLAAHPEYFAIRVYQLKTAEQEARVDSFLQAAFLPALHRQNIKGIGVFKAIGNDTAAIRHLYVFIPLKTLDQYADLLVKLSADEAYHSRGLYYHDAPYDNPSYIRMETILLKAFPDMPQHAAPWTGQPYSPDRVYELRSYEGPSEGVFANKVQMFNEGGEVTLFDKLGFHAVFYATVLSGAHMPNLMYMTSFENMAVRDEHWKTFGADPTWKSLSSSPQYQHNVSHIDDIFLHAARYSEL